MKYIVMGRDELGDCFRAFGSKALEAEYTYPAIDWDDDLQVEVFYAWKSALEERLQKEWEEHFGPESYMFLEQKYSDMSLSDWARLGYDTRLL